MKRKPDDQTDLKEKIIVDIIDKEKTNIEIVNEYPIDAIIEAMKDFFGYNDMWFTEPDEIDPEEKDEIEMQDMFQLLKDRQRNPPEKNNNNAFDKEREF